MERAMAQGFFPDTISSDLHIGNVDRTVYDLLTTLSKFLHLGMTLSTRSYVLAPKLRQASSASQVS